MFLLNDSLICFTELIKSLKIQKPYKFKKLISNYYNKISSIDKIMKSFTNQKNLNVNISDLYPINLVKGMSSLC